MKRFVIVGGALALVVAVSLGQDPRPAQPPAVQVQPKLAPITKAVANRISAAEEEVETLEAQRETRKAHARAAEVGVQIAQVKAEDVAKLTKQNVVSQAEYMMAKLNVDAAKAQFDVRAAEVKEIEVKLKYAKKRLDDVKAGIRPAAGVRPVDPPSPQ